MPLPAKTGSLGGPNPLDKYFDQPEGSAATGIQIMVHARPKVGKTSLAATASQLFTPDTPCFLEDMLFLVMDADGLAALESRTVKGKPAQVRAHTLNMLQIWGELGFVKGQRVLREKAGEIITKHPDIEWIVTDSLTAMDIEANAAHYDNDSEADSYTKFRMVLGEHRMFHSWIRRLGKNIIHNVHSKMLSDLVDDKAEKKRDILRMAGGGDIVPGLTGQALPIYQKDISAQFYLSLDRSGARSLHTLSAKGAEAGSRYGHLLNAEESPDLLAIQHKILAARAKEPTQ